MPLTDPPPAPDALRREYHDRGLDELSDTQLVQAVAEVLAQPRSEPANSFVLHAPLELAARTALLPRVRPDRRTAARLRLVALAAEYQQFGPPVVEPPARRFSSVPEAALRLAEVVDAGDLDEVDAVARWLGRSAKPRELRQLLADTLVPRLSAAAHGTIFLYQLPRVAPRGEIGGELLRSLARELARYPDWRLSWQDDRAPSEVRDPSALFDAIAATPRLGLPGSDFIFPIMSQVESTDVAAGLLAAPTRGVPVAAAAPVVLRAAALSMLSEPTDSRPYGWTHALTLPQAALGVAAACGDPSAALAVAATYVVGFRAAVAQHDLPTRFEPDDPGITLDDALEEQPAVAAAAVWHAPERSIGELVTRLATNAATHRDAHLVKYTLACFDAAASDRDWARLYLAAAAELAGYWAEHPDPNDPLG
jgi:hypothetical protein